jgi:hypothetical protein
MLIKLKINNDESVNDRSRDVVHDESSISYEVSLINYSHVALYVVILSEKRTLSLLLYVHDDDDDVVEKRKKFFQRVTLYRITL